MGVQSQVRLTPEEYLAIERRAETRSEYFDGEMFAMTGASPLHALITANIVAQLWNLLRGGPCAVFSTDLRLRVDRTGLYCYPDVMVVCGELMYADEQHDTVLNPSLIVEVLSPSTADYDRGGKFAHYRSIPSVTDYLLVAQDHCHVELYHREGERWIFTETDRLDGSVALASVGIELELAQVYHKADRLGLQID